MKYLLPCECGEAVPVEPTQAGQSVSCGCGRTLIVPSMRAVRQLAPTTGEEPKRRRNDGWNPVAGAAFAAGALLIVCGVMISSYAQYNRLQWMLPPPEQEPIDEWVGEVDAMPADQLLDLWAATRNHGIGDYYSSPYVMARFQTSYYTRLCWIGLVVLGGGALVIVIALLLRMLPAGRT